MVLKLWHIDQGNEIGGKHTLKTGKENGQDAPRWKSILMYDPTGVLYVSYRFYSETLGYIVSNIYISCAYVNIDF